MKSEKIDSLIVELNRKNQRRIKIFWTFSIILILSCISLIVGTLFLEDWQSVFVITLLASVATLIPFVVALIKSKHDIEVLKELIAQLKDPKVLNSGQKELFTQRIIKTINE